MTKSSWYLIKLIQILYIEAWLNENFHSVVLFVIQCITFIFTILKQSWSSWSIPYWRKQAIIQNRKLNSLFSKDLSQCFRSNIEDTSLNFETLCDQLNNLIDSRKYEFVLHVQNRNLEMYSSTHPFFFLCIFCVIIFGLF